MFIRLRKSGGVAGIRRPAFTIDGDALPPQEADEWRRRLDAADFFNQPERLVAGPGADQFQYEIAADLNGRQHTVRFGERHLPPGLRALFEALRSAAEKNDADQ